MTAPAITYRALSGQAIYGGTYPPPFVPAWITNSGQWNEAPNSIITASGVGWTGTSPGGSGNYTSVLTAWSGGVLNTKGCLYGGTFHTGTFLVIFGAGHSDYGGNEIYAYGPMEDASPTWHRLTDPTIPAPDNVGRDGSGNPVARHSYDMLQYSEVLNQMICMGASGGYHNGFDHQNGELFDFATNTWIAADSGMGFTLGSSGFPNSQGGYNPTTREAWLTTPGNGNVLMKYSESTGAFTTYAKDNPDYSSDSKAAIDPIHNLLVQIGSSGQVLVQDLNNPTSVIVTVTTTGTAPFDSRRTIDWDASKGRFVAWDGGMAVYFLQPPTTSPLTNTWVWTHVTPPTGPTPGVPETAGTYGRMRATVKFGGGFFLLPNESSPLVFYKY
jgi:hypothetical protein